MSADLPLSIARNIGRDLDGFGGVLRCETCGATDKPNPGHYLAVGWPTCHGQTMRWWTQRQIDAGEMPSR